MIQILWALIVGMLIMMVMYVGVLRVHKTDASSQAVHCIIAAIIAIALMSR